MINKVSTLAIHGNKPVRDKLFTAHVTVGEEEKEAVLKVLDSGILSNYLGAFHENFMGGNFVRKCEEDWASHFKAKHALAVNSNTSGLIAALGAIGLGEGDEVIVSPYSMSISAIAPVFWGATPIFADAEPDTFCMSPQSIEAVITEKTKAILIVDLFGQPFDVPAIKAIAQKYNLKIIEDCAQAPGAFYRETPAGLLGDIGVFSLNYHKHIHSGEGGIVVTNDDGLAQRVALIRNHAESVVGPMGVTEMKNMLGYNFRMTEIEAAIASCQLVKLPKLMDERNERVAYFESKMRDFPALQMPKVRENSKHAYYVHACLWQENACDIGRNQFIDAVKAELPFFELREKEGVKLSYGYVKPLYLLPAFKSPQSLGSAGNGINHSWQKLEAGLCPVVEDLHLNKLVSHEFIVPSMTHRDIDDVVNAFEKVWENRSFLTPK